MGMYILQLTANFLFICTTDIVEIKHIMLPPNARDFKDIFVVFELMETDLHQVGKVLFDVKQS